MSDDRERIEAAWRALTASVGRPDPPAAVVAAYQVLPCGLLQAAAAGVLLGMRESVPESDKAALNLAAEVRARAWTGDLELAEQLEALQADRPTGKQLLAVALEDLADLLDGEEGGWLDLESGVCWPQEILDGGADEVPDPESDPGRWLSVFAVGSRAAWQDMADFAALQPDPVGDQLRHALKGRGAFGRFRQTLDRYPSLLIHWRVLSNERRIGRARAWLADAGYDSTT
jgi:hypothetical protein